MKIRNLKLKIIGMHCTSCTMNIDGNLEDMEGVRSAKTSYARQECEVEFEERIVRIEQIVKTIENTGYKVSLKDE